MMKKVTIAIFEHYGLNTLPEALEHDLPEDFLQNRIELAKRLEALPFTHDTLIDGEDYNDFQEIPINDANFIHFRVKSMPNLIMVRFPSDSSNDETMVTLMDIDTTTPWKLEEYDGFERIVYHTAPTILDEESNYSIW